MMKEMFLGFAISGCMMVNGMNVEQERVNLYYPEKAVMALQPVTIDSFKRDSDDLYISIDEFKDEKDRKLNERAFFRFIAMYGSLVITQNAYNDAFEKIIVPDFKKFVEEDACSEVSSFYPNQTVIEFSEYIKKRLFLLNALALLGNACSQKGNADE